MTKILYKLNFDEPWRTGPSFGGLDARDKAWAWLEAQDVAEYLIESDAG